MRIGAVEVFGIVTMISGLVAGAAVLFVLLGGGDPDCGKAQVLDVL